MFKSGCFGILGDIGKEHPQPKSENHQEVGNNSATRSVAVHSTVSFTSSHIKGYIFKLPTGESGKDLDLYTYIFYLIETKGVEYMS